MPSEYIVFGEGVAVEGVACEEVGCLDENSKDTWIELEKVFYDVGCSSEFLACY